MEVEAWEPEAMEEVVMVDMVQALGAFSQELDRRRLKEVQEEALCYHMEEEFPEVQELEPQCPLEYLLFRRQAFQEGVVVLVLERKLPKCQVWVCLDFTKVDWCQDKGLVDVACCLEWPQELT